MRLSFLVLVLMTVAMSGPLLAQPQPANDAVYIRMAHFAPDVGPIDLYIDEQTSSVQSLRFGELSAWFTLPLASYDLHITAADVPPSDDVLVDVSFTPQRTGWHTLALIGSRVRESLAVQVIDENYSELQPGEARLSVFHGIEQSSAVDVLVNGDALFEFINYPGAQQNNENDGFASADLVAGVYRLRIVSNVNEDEVLLDLGEIKLIPDNNYLVAAMGTTEQPQSLVVPTDVSKATIQQDNADLRLTANIDSGQGEARFAHFSSGTPAVDVYINDNLSRVEALDFTEISSPLDLTTGTQTIVVTPAGLSPEDAFIAPVEVDVEADSRLMLALVGTLDNGSLRIQVIEENTEPLERGFARFSVFHAAPSIRTVNIQRANGAELIRLLGYPGSQGSNDGYETIDLLSGRFTIEVVSASDPDEIIVSLDRTWLSGRNYMITLIRAEPPYLLTVQNIETATED